MRMDHDYASKKLEALLRDLPSYTGDDFWRQMSRIAAGATGNDHAEEIAKERDAMDSTRQRLLEERNQALQERDALAAKSEHLQQEAMSHAQEARSQRATVLEIYQLSTGATGEPGDWHGAEPVRQLIEQRDALAAPNRDMVAHMQRQIAFSTRAFGPGDRQAGVIDHIRKELHEIEEAPHDLEEWIDVVLLALDGAWRSGHSGEAVVAMLDAKLTKNENREWPDWRTADRTKAIEHDRTKDREPTE